MNLSKEVKITTALDYVSAADSRNGAILDMSGYEGVLMIVKFAAIAPGATVGIKAQEDTDPLGGTMADLAGTAQVVAHDDDDQVFYIDLYRPKERYVRLVVTKDGANAAAESAIYLQYSPRKRPVANVVADEVSGELHVSPAEGTA